MRWRWILYPTSSMTAAEAREALSMHGVVANKLSPIIVAEIDRLGLRKSVTPYNNADLPCLASARL